MARAINFQIDKEENLLQAILWETDADGALERKITATTLDELPPAWAEAIRLYVRETGELNGEVEVP